MMIIIYIGQILVIIHQEDIYMDKYHQIIYNIKILMVIVLVQMIFIYFVNQQQITMFQQEFKCYQIQILLIFGVV